VLNQFARGRETVPIDKFTLADVEKFLDSKSLQYRATVRGKLSTLFNFCVRRGYRLDNPCSRLEPIKVTKAPPQIFTVKQFATAAEWFKSDQPKGLSWFALATLCGLRPEEAEKTTEADIHFKEGFVKVEAQTTKVRQRRVVYPKPEAMAFLEWSLKNGGVLPIGKAARMKIISGRKSKYPGLRHALDFTAWPKDITRHTAASYWLASDGSAAHVADMLGNSERVLKRDYKALVTRAEAVEFWRAVTSACNYEHTSRRAA
jgi:integrase